MCESCNLQDVSFDLRSDEIALFQVPLTIAWALYNLSRCPDIQERAREELVERMPTKQSKYYKNIEGKRRGELLFDPSQASSHVQAILRETLSLVLSILTNNPVAENALSASFDFGGFVFKASRNFIKFGDGFLVESNRAASLVLVRTGTSWWSNIKHCVCFRVNCFL
ncbi:hypothetical protein TNCV_381531 [Trichonephila clavipes]|uniref:Uncharacterized protein n=1 Tax=Trichonephila clavipes TaxID=2585209 RepID=A0A8X6SDX4_TRICX|nr:hypothetical protein TNCV_381531 [Trichonephila clavipes]